MVLSEDLISLIVPVYKVEKYLDRCVESLINQTYKNIEILLVDDGSPDNSGQLAENWKKRDGRVVVFHKSNGGLSSARNFGIRQARGKYIGFVDSDDYVDTRFVESLYALIQRFGVKLAAVGYKKTRDSAIQSPVDVDLSQAEVLNRHDAIRELYINDKYADYAWNKLYLKELFNGIEYPEGRTMEDLGTTYLLIDKCDAIAFNPAKLYYYFQREGSITSEIDLQLIKDCYAMCKQKYIHIKEKHPDIEINSAIFFRDSLLRFPYQDKEERLWIKKELEMLWPQIKKTASPKVKVKYFFCTNMGELYSKFCRTKHHYQDLFRRLI